MRPDPDVGSREPSPTIEAVADGPAEPSGGEVLPAHDEPVVDTHHHPLRFTWQMDADGRFSLGSGEFTRLIGAGTAAGFGRQWCEIAERFALDPDCHIAKAIATHDTWSGITLNWPVDGGSRLPVELSGLPVFDRTRNFAGYRGFGVCRDLDGLTRLAALRRFELLSQVPPRPPSSKSELTKSDVTSSAATELPASAVTLTSHRTDCEKEKLVETPPNVVPFRPIGEAKSPGLTPVENSAFDELARQLSVRLDRDNGTSAETPVPSETSAVAIEPSQGQPVPVAPHDQVEWLALPEPPALGETRRDKMLLDLLPTGILIYRLDRLLYANPAFLECVGYSSLHALEQAGGLDALYVEAGVSTASSTSDAGTPVRISASAATVGQASPPATDGRLFTISWDGDSALALIFSPAPTAPVAAAAAAAAPPNPPPAAGHASAEDLGAILESEVQQARRLADRAANVKADMLARISHEVRTPLNAIIGFAEVMIGERFGALGNELYVEYMKDIRASGERVIVIIDELLELSRIETGKLDLTFADQNLNDIVESCVAVMQPQANRERIIIRTSLAHLLPPVVADARALRQITLNLIGNSMHLANAGGQVIVSTALTDCGEVALRVRDTGHGLNDDEVAAALETAPPSDQASGGPAVNLSLTKALVEANRAQFHLKTCAHSGTLIEVVFSHAMARA
jgi:signal transduction histidine kinase